MITVNLCASLKSGLGVEQLCTNIIETIPFSYSDFYSTYRYNEHHLTTSYWNTTGVKFICNRLKLNFDITKFKLVNYAERTFDLSYLTPIESGNYSFFNAETGKTTHGTNESLRCPLAEHQYVHGSDLTKYHKLFIGAHQCGVITNHDIKSNDVLLLNTDSMSIPIVPVLATFFKTIIHLDNRTKMSFKYLYNDARITHYMCLINSHDWNHYKFLVNLQ